MFVVPTLIDRQDFLNIPDFWTKKTKRLFQVKLGFPPPKNFWHCYKVHHFNARNFFLSQIKMLIGCQRFKCASQSVALGDGPVDMTFPLVGGKSVIIQG